MTENKRYTSSEDIGCLDVPCSNIHDKGEFIGTAILSDVEQLCDLLNEQDARINELEEENEELKQQLDDCRQKKQNIKDMLLYSEPIIEQKKIQELIYKIVFDLIDEKIKEYQKYDGYDTEKFYIGTQLLNELKKELKGDDVE